MRYTRSASGVNTRNCSAVNSNKVHEASGLSRVLPSVASKTSASSEMRGARGINVGRTSVEVTARRGKINEKVDK